MAGRLTLTWANKDRALLSHGEDGYEWVDRDDPRAREVRLLDEIPDATGRVGEATGGPSDNLLVRGDSLDALRALVRSPEYAAEYRGKVKLVYIDPPFNTGQAFEHYDDSLEHSVWLGMMRERLVPLIALPPACSARTDTVGSAIPRSLSAMGRIVRLTIRPAPV